MTTTTPQKMTKLIWAWLEDTRPGIASILRDHKVDEMLVEFHDPRTKLIWPTVELPKNTNDQRWMGFDRQIDGREAILVLDGTLEDNLSRTVHKGRVPLRRPLQTGEEVWIDPKLMHRPPHVDCGPWAEERAAKVTVTREAFMAMLRFEDGHEIMRDIDELMCGGQVWLDPTEE